MTRDEAAALVAPFYAAFASGDAASLDAVFAPDWRDNTPPPGREPGLAGMKTAVAFLRAVLPDLRAATDDVRVDGDVVTVRATFTGTNTGGWPGREPNGAAVRFLALDMHRVAHGRVVESWHLEDNLGLLVQLGAVTL